MRDIEFRGKRKDNGGWVYGFYLESKVNRWIYCHDREESSESVFLCHAVIPETVGQYIGLNDINGVKIFEGDIIDLSRGGWQEIFVVAWGGACCGYSLKQDNEHYCLIDQGLTTKCMRVIGNIHENPELLKEASNV